MSRPTTKADVVDERLLHHHDPPATERRQREKQDTTTTTTASSNERGEDDPRVLVRRRSSDSNTSGRINHRRGIPDGDCTGTSCPVRTVARQGLVPGVQLIASLDEQEDDSNNSETITTTARVVDTEQELRVLRQQNRVLSDNQRLVRERDAYRDLVENAVVAQAVDEPQQEEIVLSPGRDNTTSTNQQQELASREDDIEWGLEPPTAAFSSNGDYQQPCEQVKKRHRMALVAAIAVVLALIVTLSVVLTREARNGTPGSAMPPPAPGGTAPTPGDAPAPGNDGGVFQGNVCGVDFSDAGKCQRACPNGQDDECPGGETCFADVSCQDAPPPGNDGAPNDDDDIIQENTCGLDFEDASEKCQTPCIQGLDSECPGEEKCWANVSCRATRSNMCGTSFQNAEEQCLTACPQGKDNECPAFEKCWASVSCLSPP